MISDACATVPFTDVSARFDFYCDQAMVRPVMIDRDGAPGVVMLATSEYARLARLDHVALHPSELDQADLDALRDSVAVPR